MKARPAHHALFTVAALGVTVALGIASRRVHLGLLLWDKSLGDTLYAVAVYLVLSLAFPRWSIPTLGRVALLLCLGLELFQLTGIPAAHAHLGVVRWLIGTRFAWHDLTCYLVGCLSIAMLDGLWRRRATGYT